MTEVVESRSVDLGVDDPRISLATERGRVRTLRVDGEPAFEVSVDCGTCGYLLSRLPGANDVRLLGQVPDRLSRGLTLIDDDVVDAFGQVLPKARYKVALLEATPTLVRPGDEQDYFTHEMVASWGMSPPLGIPHWPGTPYYRLGTTPFTWRTRTEGPTRTDVQWRSALFEMLVPFTKITEFDIARLERFRTALVGGDKPTAVAVSLLDIERWAVPAVDEPSLDAHWIWTHFLLDGHHKTFAAALERKPLTLLTFTMVKDGLSDPEQVDRACALLEHTR